MPLVFNLPQQIIEASGAQRTAEMGALESRVRTDLAAADELYRAGQAGDADSVLAALRSDLDAVVSTRKGAKYESTVAQIGEVIDYIRRTYTTPKTGSGESVSPAGLLPAPVQQTTGTTTRAAADPVYDAGMEVVTPEGVRMPAGEMQTPPKNGQAMYSMDESGRIQPNMTETERAQILSEKTIKAPQAKPELLNQSDLQKLENTYRRKARPLLKQITDKFGLNKSYANADIELEFDYSGKSLNESIAKQDGNYDDMARMFTVFDEVVENAVAVEAHGDRYADTGRNDPFLNNTYVMLSAYRDGESVVPVKLVVKEFTEGAAQNNKIYLAVTAEKIGADLLVQPASTAQGGGHNYTTSAPEISVAELVGKINPGDGELLKYLPDEMLSGEQPAAKQAALEQEQAKYEAIANGLTRKNGISSRDVKEESGVKEQQRADAIEVVRRALRMSDEEKAKEKADKILSDVTGIPLEQLVEQRQELSRQYKEAKARGDKGAKTEAQVREQIAKMPKNVRMGQQRKHIEGTHEYEQYVQKFRDKGEYGPSRITISEKEIQQLIHKYSGTGEIRIMNGKWLNYEIIVDCDKIIGEVVNNWTGERMPTTVFKLHYSKYGVHLVPDYPSKKGGRK